MTMKFDLAGFAAHCLTMEADVKLAQEAAMEKACMMVEKAAKKAIGKYLPGYNWPELAAATQEERVRLGFSRNKPLLRTGDLRDSISHVVGYEGKELVGYVGSPLKIALYQEMGTGRIPPRPFLSASLMAQERAIVDLFGRMVVGALERGGPNYREMREMLHILHRLGHEIKEAAEKFLDDDDDSDDREQ